ncbi:hypothetical protein ALC60_10997 [Trachymyrmex zeteki]|uniref:Uncharacterized protein n=1 Tax=Mycetomoellerius zeteki TaxID=64791 RepID=A0A151WQ37_9HYME|nr:hypothetical protein ALC60_10997 [Trachymyrmex zeteki]
MVWAAKRRSEAKRRRGEARRSKARRGEVRRGEARRGEARRGGKESNRRARTNANKRQVCTCTRPDIPRPRRRYTREDRPHFVTYTDSFFTARPERERERERESEREKERKRERRPTLDNYRCRCPRARLGFQSSNFAKISDKSVS